MKINIAQLASRLSLPRLAEQASILEEVAAEFEITTPNRLAAFLAQLCHESQEFTRFEENLNYSWQGLRKTFPKYFKTDEVAKGYHRQPERIANRVYANRLGNGNEASGDGWKFRGRGPIQLTGRNNYIGYGALLGLALTTYPDLLLRPEFGFRAAGHFWQQNYLNSLADEGKFEAITKVINGGLNGQEEREAYYQRFLKTIRDLNKGGN